MAEAVAVPVGLLTDGRATPLGIDSARPRLSWRLPEGCLEVHTYEVQVAGDESFTHLVWECGPLGHGDEPIGVAYAGEPLGSGQRYWWRVRVSDTGEPAPWSSVAAFETGILDPGLWHARWISGPTPLSNNDFSVLYLRQSLRLSAPVVRGRAYVSALGWYRFLVNGTDLTGPALLPRWTPFDKYVEYQSYDVTDVLRAGHNVIALAVGDGRYRGRLSFFNQHAVYGRRLAGFAQLHLEFADGSSVTVATDDRWHAGPGRILKSDPKFGERVDLRVKDDDWLSGADVPGRFVRAEVLNERRTLIAEAVAPVREVQKLRARSVTRSPSGKQIVDFGQNFAGVVRIRLTGAPGAVIRLTHSEILKADGELDTDYLRMRPLPQWFQRDEVTLDGEQSWWQPWFTIHGFRYVEIQGLSSELLPADVEGVVLSSDLPVSGDFNCSDGRLNQLHHNVGWSLRSNFVDTPTDCPTRERSGWTGDIQVFASTATTFVDVQAYLRRYLRNLAAEQLPDGRVPIVVPSEGTGDRLVDRIKSVAGSSVGWGDVAVLLPWTLYRHYGDVDVLSAQYSSMTAWVDHLARRARRKSRPDRWLHRRRRPDVEAFILDTGYQFGEWLRPGADLGVKAVLDGPLHGSVVATAYLEHSARLLSTMATVIGRSQDADNYRLLADNTRRAWRTVFLHADGRVGTDRQDDYVRALAFDLLDEHEQPEAIRRLVALIERDDWHLGTGFLSTPMLLPVLVDGGRADVAWRLLLQTTTPSWLHQIERGATTVWETWEGYDARGRAKDSHNHYAFGAVAGFLTERIAGITPAEPGYRIIDVNPLVGSELTYARASVRTPYGVAASSWQRSDQQVTLNVTVPPGATGRIHTGGGVSEVGAGAHDFTWAAPA
jgi:alpha-L-rhamnosidase